MNFASTPTAYDDLRLAISEAFLADETACVETLLHSLSLDDEKRARIQSHARELVAAVRARQGKDSLLDAFLHEYDLSSQEGVVLMCLAEALLRIPDTATVDSLIRDKLVKGQWDQHLGHSPSLLVNASTWGLLLTGRIVKLAPDQLDDTGHFLGRLALRVGEPVIRAAIKRAMRILGEQFVMGRDIGEALRRAEHPDYRAYRHSYDMLGEAALTRHDADRYTEAYLRAIHAIAVQTGTREGNIFARPSISVKLSALHPRYEFAQRERVMTELPPRLHELARAAKQADLGLTLDAEEADRLDLSLDIFAAVFGAHELKTWEGLGLAVQAYQKRALPVLNWLIEIARSRGKRIPLRLVKGAYWDTEIKRAQQAGLVGYPVFTRKVNTDVSYLACVKRLFDARDALFPQFATHNAHTVAGILEIASRRRDFEFQRLHGMGGALYAEVLQRANSQLPCRVYAPVGSHEELLPYLVRRLLENGANSSFVNRLEDQRAPVERLIADPLAQAVALASKPHPRIPPPAHIYPDRGNSEGINLADPLALQHLAEELNSAFEQTWRAAPLVEGKRGDGEEQAVFDPSDRRRRIGGVVHADAATVTRAITSASAAAPAWERTAAEQRAAILENAADKIERHRAELTALCIREGGKTVADALAEVREAADFCRYYATRARRDFGAPLTLAGPTGEHNELQRHGRGVFACISPWNFPLAIFIGQVSAALAAGNAVIAKPAGQTPLVAYRAIQLLHDAGVPPEVLHFVPGAGSVIGALLSGDERVTGIAFTGSTATAKHLQRALAARSGAIVPLIAETGGQNCMIADSSALPEQVVKDVIRSAFNSAGQRCSALRVLFLQEEIAPKVIEMLAGAMAELSIGDPALLSSDIGPVIDETARYTLTEHAVRMSSAGRLIYQTPLPAGTEHGCYFAPRVFEIDRLAQLQQEIFGPVLHIIRYAARDLEQVIDDINATGYGLTVGIHSRIEATTHHLQSRLRVGNCYLNRDMIGAVVGVQPFGGEGLSGTGPKAGGPDYLLRFAVERTLTVNTAAVGGNTALLSLSDE